MVEFVFCFYSEIQIEGIWYQVCLNAITEYIVLTPEP